MVENPEIIISRVISVWIFTIVTFLFVYITTNTNKEAITLFQIGPNSELFILHIAIDTTAKYITVVTFCFVNSIFRSLNHNILQPWIINEIQDVSKNNITNIGFCYELSCNSAIYNWFDFFMYMHILMSQIDLLFVEIVADVIITGVMTKYYIDKKFQYSEIK
jgi:hypothetical protein